jgi:hypothetical protein
VGTPQAPSSTEALKDVVKDKRLKWRKSLLPSLGTAAQMAEAAAAAAAASASPASPVEEVLFSSHHQKRPHTYPLINPPTPHSHLHFMKACMHMNMREPKQQKDVNGTVLSGEG